MALRHRGSRASTFFAAPTTARLSRGRTLHQHRPGHDIDGTEPALPGSELDEETRRWLIEYPQDPELVPLIASLRKGGQNDEFVLSEVGLLYLRPDESDPTGAALLVPPNGVIRREILEDTHIDPQDQEHRGYEEMLDELERVFWWVGMEDDIDTYMSKCVSCAQRQLERGTATGSGSGSGRVQLPRSEQGQIGTMDDEDGSKSTYTGITGWTGDEDIEGEQEGDIAVEMAVAMRKANEDAQRPWAG